MDQRVVLGVTNSTFAKRILVSVLVSELEAQYVDLFRDQRINELGYLVELRKLRIAEIEKMVRQLEAELSRPPVQVIRMEVEPNV